MRKTFGLFWWLADAVGRLLLFGTVLASLGFGAIVTGFAQRVTEEDLFLLGVFLLVSGVSMVGMRVALAHVPARYLAMPAKPIDPRAVTTRMHLVGIRGELEGVATLIRERMHPEDDDVWWPSDPFSVGQLSTGRWNQAYEFLAGQREVYATFSAIQTAYSEVSRIDRIREAVWHDQRGRGSMAAARMRLTRSIVEDGVLEALSAISDAIASIDGSLNAL